MKPTKTEEQHIRELELSRRLQMLEAEQQAAAEAKKSRLKELHWMHCPKCGLALTTQQYGPVEIDVYPQLPGAVAGRE